MDIENITTDDLTIFLGVLFGIAILSGLFALIAISYRNSENAKQPIQTAEAKLLEKQKITDELFGPIEMYFVFETSHGERLRLMAKSNNTWVPGDIGNLTWQGNKVISFGK
ncbi:MAG: hypothetical protein IJX76_01230 [Clostridia bacterium]|nr:hypothetical protein [Clostridia bacterium]